jgi:hypothetical protein
MERHVESDPRLLRRTVVWHQGPISTSGRGEQITVDFKPAAVFSAAGDSSVNENKTMKAIQNAFALPARLLGPIDTR